MLKDYAKLDEGGKQKNRSAARGTLVHLFGLGLNLRRELPTAPTFTKLSDLDREALMRAEHDRWLRESLLQRWGGAKSTNPRLRLNQDVVQCDKLRNVQ